VTQTLNSPELLLYQWIADIASQDVHVAIAALKAISAQLKKDSAIFSNHVDALMMSLLTKMQSQFAVVPLPVRMCKYVAFSILTLCTETKLAVTISDDAISQLCTELLKNLSAGLNESILNQVLNAIVLKLIEDSPLRSFQSFLKMLGDSDSGSPDKRMRLALKCFEASGLRLGEVGTDADLASAIEMAQGFLARDPNAEQTPGAEKVSAALKQLQQLAASRGQGQKADDELEPVQCVRMAGKGSRKIIAPEVPRKIVPLRHLRLPKT